jgi:hypothetical protein
MTHRKWEKFFFHIVSDGIRHEDDHGTELASLEDAYIHVQSVARWLGRGASLTNGFETTPSAYIEIESGSGRTLMLCTVAHLLAMSSRKQAGRMGNRQSGHKIIDLGQYSRLRQLGNRARRRSMFSRQSIMRYAAEREPARAKQD